MHALIYCGEKKLIRWHLTLCCIAIGSEHIKVLDGLANGQIKG